MVSTVIRLAPLALLVVTARAAVAEQAVVPVRRATAIELAKRGTPSLSLTDTDGTPRVIRATGP